MTNNGNHLYLKSVEVTNIGPFTEKTKLEFGPSINYIEGDNWKGKTTFLDAVKNFFEGGSNAHLMTTGAAAAEAAILFSDGTTASKKVTTKEGESTVKLIVKGPAGEVKRREVEWLNERIPKGASDVEAFLKSEQRERSNFITQRLSLVFQTEVVNSTLQPLIDEGLLRQESGPVLLERLNKLYQEVEDLRKKANTDIRDREIILARLRGSELLKDNGDADWDAEAESLQAHLTEIQADIASTESEIKREAESERALLRKAADDQIAAIRLKLAEGLRLVDQDETASIAGRTEQLQKDKARVSETLATARGRANLGQQAKAIQSEIATYEEECAGLNSKQMARDGVLKALERLKHEKLKELPIDGLDIQYDSFKRPVITVKGVPLERMSGAEALIFAFQVVTLSAGTCRTLFLDDSVRITDTNMPAVEQACREYGYQLIAGRQVPGAKLSVRQVEGKASA